MMRTIVALLCMAVMSTPGFAHGNEQASQESVTVETNTKATVEVMVSSYTKFSKNDASATPSELHVDSVVIHAMPMKDGKLMAHTVQVGVAKASANSH
jgi:hypothetical protein